MNTDNTQSLADYVDAFRRRLPLFTYIALPILIIAGGLAVGLPDIYRSVAEVQVNVEGQAIGTVDTIQLTTFADQYVGTLQRNVLSRKNMLSWAKEFQVFPNLPDATDSDLVREMSTNIRVNLVTTGVLEPRSGRELELITGFTASFGHRNPEMAHKVAERLAQAFLEEDRKIGLEQSVPVLSFLQQQMNTKLAEISQLESELATFKEQNPGRLPDMMALNMSVLDRYERELESIEQEIRNLQEERIYRQRQLDETISSSAVASQLADLQREYVEMLSKYGSDHPDLIRMRRQIESLSDGGTLTAETAEIASLQAELAELSQRYSDEHPDVVRLRRQIDQLRSEQQNALSGLSPTPENDPRYLNLKADINANDVRLRGLRSRQAEIRSKINETETKIAQMPQVERQLMALERDLDSAREAYNKLRQDADETQGLIDVERELGARLTLVREPWVPESPASPHRLAIIIIGLFLALSLGGMSAIAAEGLDSTIRGSRDIQSLLHAKPIVAIPVVQNSVVRAERRKRIVLITGSFLVLITIVFSLSGITRLSHFL
jgi:uncharacterized protein involved in exopolysaccharide biosynthesis